MWHDRQLSILILLHFLSCVSSFVRCDLRIKRCEPYTHTKVRCFTELLVLEKLKLPEVTEDAHQKENKELKSVIRTHERRIEALDSEVKYLKAKLAELEKGSSIDVVARHTAKEKAEEEDFDGFGSDFGGYESDV